MEEMIQDGGESQGGIAQIPLSAAEYPQLKDMSEGSEISFMVKGTVGPVDEQGNTTVSIQSIEGMKGNPARAAVEKLTGKPMGGMSQETSEDYA